MGYLAKKCYSGVNVLAHGSKIQKYKKFNSQCSLSNINEQNKKKIQKNFKIFIRRLIAIKYCSKRKSIHFISFLNIIKSCQSSDIFLKSRVNLQNQITSIENLISQHFIAKQEKSKQNQNNCESSLFSMTEPLLSQIILAQPQLSVYFVCLFDKITKTINLRNLTKKQNQNLVKGTWNILVKYWKDKDYILFTNVDQKVQWGLLQVLGFKFQIGRLELFQAEQKLRGEITNSSFLLNVAQQSESHYFCTLQHIE